MSTSHAFLATASEVVHLASNATLASEAIGDLLAVTQEAYKGRENAVRKESRC